MCAPANTQVFRRSPFGGLIYLVALVATFTACSGGDSDAPPPPPPAELEVSISASPLVVAPGETTLLTWTSTGAASVSVTSEPGGPFLQGASARATYVSPPLNESTTFRVTATRGEEEVSATVSVQVSQRPLSIASFSVTPSPVRFGEPVTIAWEAENAARIELFENRRALAVRFEGASEGEYTYVADRAQLSFNLRAFDAADAVATSTIVVDVELPETAAVARREDSERSTVSGVVGPRATAVIEVDVQSPGVLVAEVGSPRLQQCDSTLLLRLIDPELRTVGTTGTVIAPTGRAYDCGRIDALRTPEMARLTEPGIYRVLVISEADVEVPFEFTVRHYDLGCGNGQVEPGETCDDGNQEDDDRCSSMCELNPLDPTTVAETFELGTFFDPFRLIRIRVDEPGMSLTAAVTAPDGGSCNTNTVVGLLPPNDNVPIGSGATVSGCGGIEQPRDAYAADLPVGVYDVYVLNPGVDPGQGGEVTIDLGLASPECGNGITEISSGEDCDDANAASGDGCTSSCSFESSIQIEVEPNSATVEEATPIALNPVGEWTTVAARIEPAGDIDGLAFNIPGGVGLEIRTYDLLSDPSVCNAPDTQIRLFTNGRRIAENDDRPVPNFSRCSYINMPGPLDAGRYQLFIREFNTLVIRNRYYVDIRMTAAQ